tara:strand:+ start:382 stop:1143 length:762 start_codon:yes stop_codon:yes gene_type:complete
MKFFLSLIFLIFYSLVNVQAKPPYDGTIWYFNDIINSNDPTTFKELVYVGKDYREMYDRRKGGRWLNKEAFIFNAIYEKKIIEIQVNLEFKNVENAFKEAFYYSETIGRLPNFLLTNVKTVWIHKGKKNYGGGNENLLIHTGRSEEYISKDIIEEVLIHEAGHTSLDWDWGGLVNKTLWQKAKRKDKEHISDYAKKFPRREDVAESILTWIAVRYRPDRISNENYEIILSTIPNRLKFFDEQNFDMFPLVLNE